MKIYEYTAYIAECAYLRLSDIYIQLNGTNTTNFV